MLGCVSLTPLPSDTSTRIGDITQELSEADLWALDDKQREEHFRLEEQRRRTEVNRARRTLARTALIPVFAIVATPPPDLSVEERAAAQTW